MLLKASKFLIWLAIASPLIANKHFFSPFVAPKALFFRLVIELAVFAFGVGLLTEKITWSIIKTKLKSPIVITTTLFTALFLITSFTAQNPSYALWSNFERGEGGWQMLHYFLFFLLIVILHTTKKDWQWLIGWQIMISVLVGIYAVAQAYALPFSWLVNPPEPISGPLGNPSYLGWYMLLNIFLTLWLALETNNKTYISYTSYILGMVIFFQGAILVVAKSRGSFAALGAGIILIAIFWLTRHKLNMRAALKGAGIILIIIISTLLIMGAIKGGVTGITDGWKSFQPRLWTWKTAITGIAEKPLLGWGVEHFYLIFDRYYDPRHDRIQPWFDRAHNSLLEYGTSGGIPLLIAYIALFYTLYRRLAVISHKNTSWLIISTLPAIYLINGLVLFEILPIYLMLFLIMAFINAYANNFSPQYLEGNLPNIHNKTNIFAYAALIPLTALTLGSLYYTIYRPLQKNRLMIEALQANNKIDDDVFKEHDTALAYRSPIGQKEAAQNLFAFTVSYFNFLKKTKVLEKIPQEKIKRIMELNKKWYEATAADAVGVKSLYLYATALVNTANITGNYEYLTRAQQLIDEGAKRAPTRLEFVRLELVSATLQKDKARYEHAIEKGKRLRPDLVGEKYNTEL